MKYIYVLLCFLVLFACQQNSYTEVVFTKLPQDTSEAQYQIIATLSGNEEIPPQNTFIKSRTTREERALASLYLEDIIYQLDLKPIQHVYKEANDNPMIDLLLNPFKGSNIYTTLAASISTNEYVILGAHYDTARNCPGANDNASAIGVLYGVLKNLKAIEKRSKHVIVVFFDQEEENLVGSRAFAKFVKKNEYNIHSVHTLDQLGWDKDKDKAIELELPVSSIESLYKQKAALLNIPVHVTNVNSTDHQSFRDLGYTAVGITEEFANGDTTPFKDTANDTFDTIDKHYIFSTTKLISNVIEELIK